MDIKQDLIETVSKELNANILNITRKRNIVEARAMYCFMIKKLRPKFTYTEIGKSLNLRHCAIIHLIKMYPIYEKSTPELKLVRKSIFKYFRNEDRRKSGLSFETIKFQNEIEELNGQIELLKDVKPKEIKLDIIQNLNELMLNNLGTEKYDLIKMRLEAFYHMNK